MNIKRPLNRLGTQLKKRTLRNQEPAAKSVEFHDNFMYVYLRDGRYISVPVTAYPRLRKATPEQRQGVEISPHGIGLHWEELDEDLSISGLVRDFGAKPVKHTAV